MISFDVLGQPAPKGSARAFAIPGRDGGRPRAVIVPDNKDTLKSWDQAVRIAARNITRGNVGPAFVGEALRVSLVFRIQRPAGHWGARGLKPSVPAYPAVKPDIDKLTRSTLDAMTGSLFDDDSRIVVLSAEKIWADVGQAGAHVEVESIAKTPPRRRATQTLPLPVPEPDDGAGDLIT